MIKLTLDTSCFDKESESLFNELAKLQDDGLIDAWHELYTEIEKDRWISHDKERIMKLFYSFSKFKSDACTVPMEIAEDPQKSFEYVEKQRGYTTKELHEIHKKIDQIVYPEGFHGEKIVNKYVDNKILALHIVRGRDIFVTKDAVLFKKDKKYKLIEKEFPSIKIRLLNNEFIRELEEIVKSV